MNVQQSKNEEYKRKMALRNVAVVLIFSVLLILSFVVSMNTGYSKLSPLDTLRTLFGGGSSKENLILFGFRLPRIVISMLVGAGLALSGCIIQGVSRNALADPGLLGINAGAGLTVILFVLFFGSQSYLSVFTLPFLALLGGGARSNFDLCPGLQARGRPCSDPADLDRCGDAGRPFCADYRAGGQAGRNSV